MNKNTLEQEAKIQAFQQNLQNFDFSHREGFGEDLTALSRQALDAAGLDFDSLETIDGFMHRVLEPFWQKLGDEEMELGERMKDIFRDAGATEAQLAWGMVEHIPLTWRQERRVEKLARKIDEVRIQMLPIMGLAAALNEAREKLTA